MVGNGRYRALRQSKTQSKYQSTVQSMSPVQSPGFALTQNGRAWELKSREQSHKINNERERDKPQTR